MLMEPNSKPERVAIYCRVSSDEQAEAGTIRNQEDFGRRYTDLHGLIVHDYYLDDGVSGTVAVHVRPEGKRLLDDARTGKFKTVLLYRVDRFARSTLYLLNAHEELKQSSVALRSMTEPFDTSTPLGEFIMTLLGSLAALERATILERTSLGKLRALRDGRWNGGVPPMGYRAVDKRLVVDPAEAEIVQRIFRLYVEDGLGLDPIAALLNAEGVPTAGGIRGAKYGISSGSPRWSSGTISRILRHKAYVGSHSKLEGGEQVQCVTPALIDQEAFDQAQGLLKERFIEATRNARRLYLLRNLIRCHCGRVVVGDGKQVAARYYYSCPNGHFRERAEILEEIIWTRVAAYAKDPRDTMAQLQAQQRHGEDDARDVSGELTAIARQLALKSGEKDAVITLYRKGRITETQLDKQLAELDVETMALQSRQDALLTAQLRAQSQKAALLSAAGILAQLQERVEQVELDSKSEDPETRERAHIAKRDLIRGLIKRIAVEEDGSLTVVAVFESDSSAVVWTYAEQSGKLTLTSTVALLRIDEAARALGVHKTTVRRWAAEGKLRSIKPPNGRYRFFIESTEVV
jgi:site-specific DNA recombinase